MDFEEVYEMMKAIDDVNVNDDVSVNDDESVIDDDDDDVNEMMMMNAIVNETLNDDEMGFYFDFEHDEKNDVVMK